MARFETKGKTLSELKKTHKKFGDRQFGKGIVEESPSFSKVKDKKQKVNLKKAWYSKQIKLIQKRQSIVRFRKKTRR